MNHSGKEPGEEYWGFIAAIWDAVSTHDGPDVFLDQFRKAPLTTMRVEPLADRCCK